MLVDMRTAATVLLALSTLACDAAEPERSSTRGGHTPVVQLDLAAAPEPPADCRAGWVCTGDCLGAAFLAGELATDAWPACVELCEPGPNDAAHHHDWWVSAVETTCEADWTDGCLWDAVNPDLTGTLAGATLGGCLRQGV